MVTKRRVGGYIFRQELNRARRANARAREALRQIVDDRPGPQVLALLLSRAALALGENLDALQEMERIVQGQEKEKAVPDLAGGPGTSIMGGW